MFGMRKVMWMERQAAREMRGGRAGGRRGRGGRGDGGGDGSGGGDGFGGGRPWEGRRGMFGGMHGRARRGDIRAAILRLLAEQPRNGYQIMQELEARSGGAWKPSSGSVYPTLQQLEDEELVAIEPPKLDSGSRTYKLTARGEQYVKDNAEDLKDAWASHAPEGGGMHPRFEIGQLIRQIAPAAMHVVQSGTPAQIAEAKKLLTDVRRALYRILSEDPSGEG